MTELSSELTGFEPVQRLARTFEPQSLRVPTGKDDLVAQAANILGALWDSVEHDLSACVSIEILKINNETICRISPFAPDGVTKTVANSGDWVAVDGSTLTGMNQEDYAEVFTKEVPIEWVSIIEPPTLVAEPGLSATLTFPQPTSANRPFSYVVNLTRVSTGGKPSLPTQLKLEPEASGRAMADVVLRIPQSALTDGAQYNATVTVTTQYKGVTATSLVSNTITAFGEPAPPPDVNVVFPQPVPPELQAQLAPETVPPQEISEKKNGVDN